VIGKNPVPSRFMTKTLLLPCKSGNIEEYDSLKRVNKTLPEPPPNCVGFGEGVKVGEDVEVNDGVNVRVGVLVDVRVGVDVIVGVDVRVCVRVKVGINNWPDAQPDSNKPAIRKLKPFACLLVFNCITLPIPGLLIEPI
jgi:hypothetical protein